MSRGVRRFMWPWRKRAGRSLTARVSFCGRGGEILTMPVTAPTRKSIPIWFFLLLLAVAIATGIGVLWQARVVHEQPAQVAQRTRENLDLRRELDRLNRTPSAPAPAAAPPSAPRTAQPNVPDRKSTRLNSSHGYISYAV